jgi:hypothetical protein
MITKGQIKCPNCPSFKVSQINPEASLLEVFTFGLFKPKTDKYRCDICGCLFELPHVPLKDKPLF